MSDLPEIYDRFEIEEQLRELQQKIDDLKTQVYFTPQSAAPVDVEVGTLAYSDGTNTDNTFGSSTEGFYYYASGTTWTPIGVGGSGNTIIVQDEGTPLSTSASTLNFVGSGVAATGTGATKTITITSGSASTDISPVDESSDTTCFPIFVTDATGETRPKTDASAYTYNAATGSLTATTFFGSLTGDVTGNVSGTAATVTEAAQTAITSVGDLTSLNVDGAVTADSLDIDGNASIAGAVTDVTTLTASGEIEGGSLDINGAASIAGAVTDVTTLTASGELEGGSLDINGNADISGDVDIASNLTMSGAEKKIDFTNSTARGTNDPNIQYAGNFLIRSTGSANTNSFSIMNSLSNPQVFNAILEATATLGVCIGAPSMKKKGIQVFETVNATRNFVAGGLASDGQDKGTVYIGCDIDAEGDGVASFGDAELIFETFRAGGTGTNNSPLAGTNRGLFIIKPPSSTNAPTKTITLPSSTGTLALTANNNLTFTPTGTPSSPAEGMVYYDSGDNKLKVYNGTEFENLN